MDRNKLKQKFVNFGKGYLIVNEGDSYFECESISVVYEYITQCRRVKSVLHPDAQITRIGA